MKTNCYSGWIERKDKPVIELGTYYCFTFKQAKIIFQAEAIKKGYDFSLVKVVEIKKPKFI